MLADNRAESIWETTRSVLDETETAGLLVFAALAISLAIAGVRHAVLLTVLFVTGTALTYGLLADFSDLLFGFWGTFGLVALPLLILAAWLLRRAAPAVGNGLPLLFLLLGVVYPCVAGLDPSRQPLYLNLCALGVLLFTAKLLVQRIAEDKARSEAAAPASSPA